MSVARAPLEICRAAWDKKRTTVRGRWLANHEWPRNSVQPISANFSHICLKGKKFRISKKAHLTGSIRGPPDWLTFQSRGSVGADSLEAAQSWPLRSQHFSGGLQNIRVTSIRTFPNILMVILNSVPVCWTSWTFLVRPFLFSWTNFQHKAWHLGEVPTTAWSRWLCLAILKSCFLFPTIELRLMCLVSWQTKQCRDFSPAGECEPSSKMCHITHGLWNWLCSR